VQHVHAGETSADDGDIEGGGVAPRCSHAYIVADVRGVLASTIIECPENSSWSHAGSSLSAAHFNR